MLNSVSDVTTLMAIQMSSAASALTNEGLEAAANSAMTELGYSFPVVDASKSMWVIKRAIRHACFILLTASAQKFKYKQVNLQQRFDHYQTLVNMMDKEYEDALASDTHIFASVSAYKLFGTAVGSGFIYDSTGNDLTYLARYINTGE